MNCISSSILAACVLVFAACGAPTSEAQDAAGEKTYRLHYSVTPYPTTRSVKVELRLSQSQDLLREMSFDIQSIDADSIKADGDVRVEDRRVVWQPGPSGGRLSWHTTVAHQRNDKGFDAWLDDAWGIFRAEDIIPRAATRTVRSASSITSLNFELPTAWSVITEYKDDAGTFAVASEARRFDQPTGWIALGPLGIRRETIAGIRVTVAAPRNQGVRRMDMIALLNWSLPELSTFMTELPPRLTIVSANDPMWRGGLSAPASIFIHSDRPLISENATSTLLHEVMHVVLQVDAAAGYDWITEGLAEYYSLELLRRSGAITARRYKVALAQQSAWADSAQSLCAASSTGATTALAVTRFRQLDKEIRKTTRGEFGLDKLVAEISSEDTLVDLEQLTDAARNLMGKSSDALHIDKLPGCHTIASDSGH